MAIVSRFDFSGQAPVAALTSAFDRVIRQEPLLTGCVTYPGIGRPRWLPARLPALHHSFATELPAPADLSLPRLNPKQGPLVHAECVEHAAGWSIVLAVHHAACDGLGLVAFLDRWLLAAAGKEGRRPRPAPDVLACLLARGRIAASWNEFRRILPKLRVGLAGIRQFVSRQVIRLGAPVEGDQGQDDGPWRPTVIVSEIDPATHDYVEARARADGVTVNDLLAAAFIAAIAESAHEARHPTADTAWIRLSVPMSLRTKSDHLLPAANRVSMVFLDRQRPHCQDHRKLIAGVHAEMELIRSHSLGHIMPMSLELGRLMPGGSARTAHRSQAQATAVLSNLGRCFHRSPLADASGTLRVGDCTLESWWVVPPVRPGTAIAVATHETAGRRTVAAHVDADALEPAVASVIMSRFAERLRDFASPVAEAVDPPPEVTAS
jgi:hypothetical protein